MFDKNNNVSCPYLQSLAWGPVNKANSWPMYYVNGYKFHTFEWGQGRATDNSGVCVRGDAGSGEGDWYGVIKQILEIEYVGDGPPKLVVLFSCDWYDPRRPDGTRIHNQYKITEVNYTKRYGAYDPFIIAQNARQVYYAPYPGKCRKNWKMVMKTKPRGRVEVEELPDDAYQVNDPIPSHVVVDTGTLPSLRSDSGEVEIIHSSGDQLVRENDESDGSDEEDEEDEFEDDVETENDEDSPQLSD